MNNITYRFSLDMFDTSSQIAIKAKKGDSACKIHITLTENGKIYKIAEGCYATLSARKADGNFIYDKCTIEGDSIVYDFASSITEDGTCQITACEGAVGCEVTLYKADSKQLTSPRFTLVVGSTIYNGEEIISSSEANALRELVEQSYDPLSPHPQSGKAVAEALRSIEITGDGVVDQTYKPTSINAQSGKAVAEAFDLLLPQISGVYDPNSDYAMNGQAVAEAISDKMDKFGDVEQVEINTFNGKAVFTEGDIFIGARGGGCFLSSPVSSAGIYQYPYDGSLAPLEVITPEGNAPYAAANKLYVDTAIGSIETALDSIIAIQNQLIGGGE